MNNLNNKQPLVSVLIPYYNDKVFLKKSIDAVLKSTYKNFELILLNHATTDCCREIAHSYKDERIKHIDMPYNLGFGGSGILMKAFLDNARGKYVKFLCADDEILPNGLQILVEYMENNPNKDFAFGNVKYINQKGKDLKENWFNQRPDFSLDNNEADCLRLYYEGASFLPFIGSIVKRRCFDEITLNTTFVMMFDMAIWISLLCKGFKIGFIDKIVCNYRIHQGQISSVKKVEQSARCCWFEYPAFTKLFLDIKDINLVKEIWKESSTALKLTKKEDIPFVVAHEFLDKSFYAYIFITEMLNDDSKREYLQKTFDFSVRELRKICYTIPKASNFKEIKKKVYLKPVKELNFLDLAFLFTRKFLELITFKNFKKKKYSL